MLSKFFKPLNGILTRRVVDIYHQPARRTALVPPTQYDSTYPKRLRLSHVVRVNWEIVPLLLVTCTSLSIMFLSIAWAINNKVDAVFTPNNRRNISRTMDLRYPTVHKIITINQRYEPWPEMQDVLDKMTMAEKRALVRLQSCNN